MSSFFSVIFVLQDGKTAIDYARSKGISLQELKDASAAAEAERLRKERIEAERLEAERIEAERLEAERIEAERLRKERIEAERLQKQMVCCLMFLPCSFSTHNIFCRKALFLLPKKNHMQQFRIPQCQFRRLLQSLLKA